jgi:hypothetical protein
MLKLYQECYGIQLCTSHQPQQTWTVMTSPLPTLQVEIMCGWTFLAFYETNWNIMFEVKLSCVIWHIRFHRELRHNVFVLHRHIFSISRPISVPIEDCKWLFLTHLVLLLFLIAQLVCFGNIVTLLNISSHGCVKSQEVFNTNTSLCP